MKWTRGYQSKHVEVREGNGGGGRGGGLIGGILPLVASRFGIGGVVVVIIGYVLFSQFAGRIGPTTDSSTGSAAQGSASADERVQFASFVLDDVQKSWAQRFADGQTQRYQNSKLIIYRGGTSTGCGYGDSATGPFYCPRDQDVYLDLDFFSTLAGRLGAQGDFAQAYVIAHEIGHHVQNQLGLTDGAGKTGAASIRIELQADCFAGLWAHDTAQHDLLENGDLEEALTAAASIGDDTLQKMGHGTVQPEKWTHGSSAQRVQWFKRGYETGDLKACDIRSL